MSTNTPVSNEPVSKEPDHSVQTFVGKNAHYYVVLFDKIQKNALSRFNMNWMAALVGFLWAAKRGNWFLFWLGLAFDVIAAACLLQYVKYSPLLAAAQESGRESLITRYSDWISSYLMWGVIIFILGRLLFGWLANRMYYRQYGSWRIRPKTPSGFSNKRLVLGLLIFAMLVPITLYRATQQRTDERECLKVHRELAKEQDVAFKRRFDCWFIDNFPVMKRFDAPPKHIYRRNPETKEPMLEIKQQRAGRTVEMKDFGAQKIDESIGYTKVHYSTVLDGVTKFLRNFLDKVELAFVATPWLVVTFVFLAISAAFAGTRVTVFVGVSLALLAGFGLWAVAMETMALVLVSTLICVVIGLPFGIWVAKSKRVSSIVTPILDIMQTIPSFAYLVPAVAFLSAGKPPAIVATVVFAMPPMIRLTALGINQVPESTKEAALAFGANPRQLLRKVELPMALPSIMAGLNQTIMLALSMATIAALIGAGGLGFIVVDALGQTKAGRGLIAGIGIALIAMIIDRIVQGIREKSESGK